MSGTEAMREKLISTLKAAGGIHNPEANAPHIADAILPLFTPAVCEAEQAIKDALMDSQYLAGVTAGWNAAQSDDPEAVLAGLLKSREGHLKGYKEAKGVLALLATDRAAGVGEPIGWQYALDPCPVTKRTRWIRTLYADEAEAQRVAADFMGEGKYLVRPVYAASPPAPANASGEVERRNNARLLASICQKARHSSASPTERDEALRDAAEMLREFAALSTAGAK